MTTSYKFQVFGTPAPQGSKRHVGRGILVESSKKVAPWREAVKWEAIKVKEGADPLTGAVEVYIDFFVRRPPSTKKDAKPITRSSGDIDKLCRSTLDAITDAGLIHDDSQVVMLLATKKHCLPNETPSALINVQLQD